MLEGLLKLPENRECADCKCKGPRWASVNLGIFISMQCSGIHRSLGVHISKIGPDLEIGLGEKLIIVFIQHVRTINDDGHSISRDLDGFPVTCSGSYEDNMVVLKQESQFAKANDCSFNRFSLQIEQGIPVLSRWLIFNRFKFTASKGVKLGPAFLLTSSTPTPAGRSTLSLDPKGNRLRLCLPRFSRFSLSSTSHSWTERSSTPTPPTIDSHSKEFLSSVDSLSVCLLSTLCSISDSNLQMSTSNGSGSTSDHLKNKV